MNAPLKRQLPLIGIVGGIGSGKSSVAGRLAERFPVRVLDADRAGHTALLEDAVKSQIRKEFGDDVFTETGEVDRKTLGRKVFGDSPECRQKRVQLERIVHPRIREILLNQMETIQATNPTVQAILLDAPILFEAGWHEICDAVVYIHVPHEVRLQRLREGRGWNADELTRREASQMPLAEKQRRSDWTIDNTTDLEETTQQFAKFWDSRYSIPLRSSLVEDMVFEETGPHAD